MNNLLKVAYTLALAFLIGACTSTQRFKNGEYAEIRVATEVGCKRPSVYFHEFSDKDSRRIRTKSMPLRVSPGVYLIGVSCGSIYHNDVKRCVKTPKDQPDASVAAYNLLLKAHTRYVYSCSMVKGGLESRISESAF